MKKHIYMAGELFSAGSVRQRLYEAELMKQAIEENNLDMTLFTPILAEHNDKSQLPTAEDIYLGDEREIDKARILFAELDNEDAGVMMELGLILRNPEYKIYAYLTDIRLGTTGEYDREHVPYGYNQFVIGGLEHYGHKIFYSFEDALQAFIEDHKER